MKINIKKIINEEDQIKNEDIIDFLLKDRQIIDKNEFINPSHTDKINFFEIFPKEEFDKMIALLKEIYEKKEMIVVYTDYDADGVTGGAIMWEVLNLLGFKVMPYVPDRKKEGYGFSIKGIDKVKKEFNPKLIISVDHGIAGADKISYAKKNDIDVIVTDHHLKGEKPVNDAVAVFHSGKFSGSGVSYFVAREIFNYFKKEKLISEEKAVLINKLFKTDYLAIASIGTIADLVPLVGFSRNLVKHGLIAFNKIERLGLSNLMKEADILGKTITTFDIGFIIAPRINALGRIDHAIDALRLLCTTKMEKADELAKKINKKNLERKDLVKIALDEAFEMLKTESLENRAIVLFSENWNEGIIGLVASKICEEYFRPTFIMTVSDGFAKGSTRSIPGFNVTDFLKTQNQYLLESGGHNMAAGFSLKKENILNFKKSVIESINKKLSKEDTQKKIEVDIQIPISKLNYDLADKISSFYPFGVGNLHPLFLTEGILTDAKLIGKDGKHLKILIKDRYNNSLEGIFFGESNLISKLSIGENIKIVFNLEKNNWGNNKKIQALGKKILI